MASDFDLGNWRNREFTEIGKLWEGKSECMVSFHFVHGKYELLV